VQEKAKITVLLGPEESDRFERYCKDRGFKKSTLIVRLIREHLDTEGFRMQRELPIAASPVSKRRS
jgi:hypothetical protein